MQLQTGAHQADIGEYRIGKTLGRGTFGKVKLGTHRKTGEAVAIKILQKARIVETQDVERVAREIHIMKLVRHPSIVQLYELIETPKYLMLVMEYAEEGELYNRIVRSKRLEEDEVCRLFGQLVDAIDYCQRLKVAHRDIKPENLLLDFQGRLKLTDFGLSNTYPDDEKLKTPCGSRCYAAPEMLSREGYCGAKVDVWSSGVVLFAMLCGCLPFDDEDECQIVRKIREADYEITTTLSSEVEDLLMRVLNPNPDERYDVEQIRRHPWMRKHSQGSSKGLLVGYNVIPVEERIMQQLHQLGYDTGQVRTAVQANIHNSITAAYYLLLKKFVKEGGSSNCELSSSTFDANLIRPALRTERHNPAVFISKLLIEEPQNNHKGCQPAKRAKSKQNNPHLQNVPSAASKPKHRQEGSRPRESIKIQEAVRFHSKDLVTPANRQIRPTDKQTSTSRLPSRDRSRSSKQKQRQRISSVIETSNISGRPSVGVARCMKEWVVECNVSDITFIERGRRMLETVVEQPPGEEKTASRRPSHRARRQSINKNMFVNKPQNIKRDVERYLRGHRG